jgi:hypothetical protein
MKKVNDKWREGKKRKQTPQWKQGGQNTKTYDAMGTENMHTDNKKKQKTNRKEKNILSRSVTCLNLPE